MKKKRIKIIIIVFSILLVLFIIGYAKFQGSSYLDNVLIFNLYGNSKNNEYTFKLHSATKQTMNVNLYSTFATKGLADEKIAPGTKGDFKIILNSSKNMRYQIRFDSKNAKPQNLMFNIKNTNKKYKNIEDLEEDLRGVINKNQTIEVAIEWVWEYETDVNQNFQDTLDGKNINRYNFDINVLSYEI